MVVDILTEESWNIDGLPVVPAVRQRARDLTCQTGLGMRTAEAVAIAVSELAHNIIDHAGTGQVLLQTVSDGARRGIVVIARDDGPGIRDIEWALTDGCSSRNGLGSGLPAARRLMDEFRIDSTVGTGTVITAKKWSDMPEEKR